ncbi:MAG: hypothetical protein UT85_C0017G0011 [Candidatus Levybacteria bacterium GW2011_GWA2_40_16]|nr:MAG: hypothetical protein UT20_C0028G0011 [Candidatus Levybacteria bacterium GW2011_GWA1_39_11]KKR27312.1 MAG: hypothetical protein UT57_C0010G0010 [Microgenomates group bacterium GW2011_GWC1_39_7]KKR49514.1 MAG: hypothetical protein UT85_C0017G0011 [Candidatus Levybacteria bacterium GW2011_GWA2_40_16]
MEYAILKILSSMADQALAETLEKSPPRSLIVPPKPPEITPPLEEQKYSELLDTLKRLGETMNDLSKEELWFYANNILEFSPAISSALSTSDHHFDDLLTQIRFLDDFKTHKLARSLINANASLIERRISKDNLVRSLICLDTLCPIWRTQEDVDIAMRHSDVIEAGITSELKLNETSRPESFDYYLEGLMEHRTPEQSQRIFTLVAEIWNKGGFSTHYRPKFLPRLMDSEVTRAKTEEFLGAILESYGSEGRDMLLAWGKSPYPTSVVDEVSIGEAVKRNLEAIDLLEKERPGITKFLTDEFGIKTFAKYPPELLIRQYDEVGSTDLPYGIVLYPRNDHNGAFYHDRAIFEKLLKQLNGRFAIRVIEAESKYEVARALMKLVKRYSPKHKISFAIIGGHGREDLIQFGGTDERYVLYSQDLLGRGVRKASEFFEQNPTIILASCWTGAPGGIGQELSEALGAKVIASSARTSIRHINARVEDGQVDFDVEYAEAESKKIFDSKKAC